jgi:hypothetical protein
MKGICIDCPHNRSVWLVDGLRCHRCYREGVRGGWLKEGPIEVEPAPAPAPAPTAPPAAPKPKQPKRKKPSGVAMSPVQVISAVNILSTKSPAISKHFLGLFSLAQSDMDRLPAKSLRDASREMGWSISYTRVVSYAKRRADEGKLQNLINQTTSTLKKGQCFLQEAAARLGWDYKKTCTVYRRLKRKGVKRSKCSEELVLEVLSNGGEMSVAQICQHIDASPRWVQTILYERLAGKVTARRDVRFNRKLYSFLAPTECVTGKTPE